MKFCALNFFGLTIACSSSEDGDPFVGMLKEEGNTVRKVMTYERVIRTKRKYVRKGNTVRKVITYENFQRGLCETVRKVRRSEKEA